MAYYSNSSISSSSSEDERQELEQQKVKAFLQENEVKKEWRDLILDEDDLVRELANIISNADFEKFLPKKKHILSAFAHSSPKDIKVVILGNTPYPDEKYCSGLAFSTSHFKKDLKEHKEIETPLNRFHEALIQNKVLEEELDYFYEHEEWAKRGVLLLNSALTITDKDGSDADIKKHLNLWNVFIKELLKEWISTKGLSTKRFVLCIGEKQTQFWNSIRESKKKSKITVLSTHETPCSEENENKFIDEVRKCFKEISTTHHDIFIVNKIRHDGKIYIRDKTDDVVDTKIMKNDDTVCVRRFYSYERVGDVVYVKESKKEQKLDIEIKL